jgi:hypothetical protein
VHRRQEGETLLALACQPEADHTVITRVADAFDEACSGTAVDELDGAVVAQQQMLGDVTDRRTVGRAESGVMTTHGEEQLVLGGGEAHPPRLGLAPAEESAQTVTEVEEAGEVGVRQPLVRQPLVRTVRSFHIVPR